MATGRNHLSHHVGPVLVVPLQNRPGERHRAGAGARRAPGEANVLLARFVGVGDGGALGVGLDGAFVQELAEPVTGVAVLGLHEESFEGRPADGHLNEIPGSVCPGRGCEGVVLRLVWHGLRPRVVGAVGVGKDACLDGRSVRKTEGDGAEDAQQRTHCQLCNHF